MRGASTETPAPKPGDIPTRPFGKTGEKLTLIGQAGGRFDMISVDDAKAITQRAYDLGINYFDNAASTGTAGRKRSTAPFCRPFAKRSSSPPKPPGEPGPKPKPNSTLRSARLKTDYVDLWQMHQVSEMDEVAQIFAPGGAIEAFEAAKKAGKCRFIGFTGHHDPYVHLEMLKGTTNTTPSSCRSTRPIRLTSASKNWFSPSPSNAAWASRA